MMTKELERVVVDGLFRFGTLFHTEIDGQLLPLWLCAFEMECNIGNSDSFLQAAPSLVNAAFLEVERSFIPSDACKFPVPAHVINEFRWHRSKTWTKSNKVRL